MRVCLMVEAQEGVAWERWEALAAACEALGYDGLHTSDHLMPLSGSGRGDALDAWTVLAALAGRTSRLRLGVLVSPVTLRHPALLARIASTVHQVSGGRAELGMGAGWHEAGHRSVGVDLPAAAERMDMLEEAVQVVRLLWDGATGLHQGTHYRVDLGRFEPMPHARIGPPALIVGGRGGPRSVALAARWGDGYNTHGATTEQCLRIGRRVRRAWREAAADRGAPDYSLMATCIAGRTDDEVDARVAAAERRAGAGQPARAWRRKLHATGLVGTVRSLRRTLAHLARGGVTRVFLRLACPEDLAMVELVGTEIVPWARALEAPAERAHDVPPGRPRSVAAGPSRGRGWSV